MGTLTVEHLISFCAVAVVLIGAYNTISKAADNRREQKKRKDQPVDEIRDELDKHKQMLASDKRCIENLEAKTDDLANGQKAVLRGVQALLEHELHNGNTQQMQEASAEINEWLISGR